MTDQPADLVGSSPRTVQVLLVGVHACAPPRGIAQSASRRPFLS